MATALLAVLAAIAFVAIRIPYLPVPLERDEGEYAYIAQRILAGDVPYRDAFDQKPPGVFAVYALALTVLPPTAVSVHVVAGVWTALSGLVLFGLVRTLAGGLAAGFACLVFAVFSTDPRLFATAANTEVFLLLPMIASAAWALRAAERGRGWWTAGLLAGVACLFKQVAVTHLAFLAVFALVQGHGVGRDVGGVVRRLCYLGAGVVCAWLPVVGLFAALDAWDPFLDAVLLHNLEYSGAVDAALGLELLLRAISLQLPSFGVAWLLGAVALCAPALAGRRAWAFLGGWWLCSLLGVSVGLYFRPHYFLQLLPALSGLVGLTLAASARRCFALASPSMAWAGFAALVGIALGPPLLASAPNLGAGSPTAISRAMYGFNPFPEAPEIARYLRNTSGPDETVFILGSEPEILFHAERRSASRFIFVYPLTAPFAGALERQQEVVREVREQRPRYLVWVNIQSSLLLSGDTERHLFQEMGRLVRDQYRLEFLARPAAEDALFDFVHGEAARALHRELLADPQKPAWVAVYRRAP